MAIAGHNMEILCNGNPIEQPSDDKMHCNIGLRAYGERLIVPCWVTDGFNLKVDQIDFKRQLIKQKSKKRRMRYDR